MNPIRIAQGPPTEEGDYKCRKDKLKWQLCTSWWNGSDLWITALSGYKRPLSQMVRAGWQFSTRIPDPEEME